MSTSKGLDLRKKAEYRGLYKNLEAQTKPSTQLDNLSTARHLISSIQNKHSHHAPKIAGPNCLPLQCRIPLTTVHDHSALPSADPYYRPGAHALAHTPRHQNFQSHSHPSHRSHSDLPTPRRLVSSLHEDLFHLLAGHQTHDDTHP